MKNIFTTLISELKDDNFESLIKHEKLLQQGWKFHYILDADLIGNYCFPDGMKEGDKRREKRKLSREYISDEQVTLHSFFYFPIQAQYEMLLEGYVQELGAMINRARIEALQDSSVNTIITSQLNDLVVKLREHRNAEGETRTRESTNVVEEFFIKIIATVLLRINGLKKTRMLIDSNRFTYETMELEDELLQDACDFEKGDEKREEIIRSLYVDLKPVSSAAGSKDRSKDANAIERTLSINNYIQQRGNGEEKKNLFLLAVDSPRMQDVFDHLKRHDVLPYPVIGGVRYNLYRTTQEYFAYTICCVYNSDKSVDHDKTIENLRNLREANMLFKKGASTGLTPDSHSAIFDNYNNLLTAFGNLSTLRSFDSLYDSIKADLDDGKIKEIKTFLEEIKREEANLLQHVIRTHAQMLDDILHEAKFNEIFLRGIDIMEKEGSQFDISKGADCVEGSYQHLPIFFKFARIEGSESYGEDILNITLPVLQIKPSGDELFEGMKQLLSRLYRIKSRGRYPLEEKLIKALLYLILPVSDHRESISAEAKKANDVEAYHWLNKIAAGKDMGPLSSEFLYIRCWVARRVGKFEKACELARRGIKEFGKDPRFYHGLMLAEYCLLMEPRPEYRDVGLLDHILEQAGIAFELYPGFIRECYDPGLQTDIMARLEDCFYNNFCYFLTEKAILLYQHKKARESVDCLKKARHYLEVLRLNGRFREKLPEYYDTAAHLEYQESFYPGVFDAQKSILAALDSIDGALLLTTQREARAEYEKEKAKIEKRLGELSQR